MREGEVVAVAFKTLCNEVIQPRPVLAPLFEVADEQRCRPDRLVLTTKPRYRYATAAGLRATNLETHTLEAKVARCYLKGPDYCGLLQALNYAGNYRWICVPERAPIWEEEADDIVEICKQHGLGLIICSQRSGRIEVEPGFFSGEFLSAYRRGEEAFLRFVDMLERGG